MTTEVLESTVVLTMIESKTKRTRSALLRRVWLVLRDHSIAGCFRTKREARAHANLFVAEHFVVGPYVLQWRKP